MSGSFNSLKPQLVLDRRRAVILSQAKDLCG